MRTLINIIIITSDHKIKVKSKTLTEASDKIFDEILSNSLDKTAVDQKIISSLKSMIITEKIISVLITAIQIIQFITANTHSVQIEHLQKMIKSNCSLIRCD